MQHPAQEDMVKTQLLVAAALITAAVAVAVIGSARGPAITEEQLVRNAQEIFDATAPGDPTPFKKYFAEDAMFFDEKGRSMDKAALLEDLKPLPQGYSGSIKVMRPKSHIEGDVAILSYDLDELETVFGQKLTARYHETDTWMRREGQWQIVAAQVLRYYEDPKPGKADIRKFPSYLGVYELATGRTITVTAENDRLYSQRAGRAREELVPEASDIFFRKGVEGRTLFGYDENGKVATLIDRRNNEDIVWRKEK
jgi:hypothetical protein